MAKRTYRNDMAQAQKDKIAAANIGKHLSQATKDKISKAMAEYWRGLPYKPGSDEERPAGTTSTDTLLKASTGTTPTQPPTPRGPFRTLPKTPTTPGR